MRKHRLVAVFAGVACLTMLIGWPAMAQTGAKDARAEITIIVPADAEVFFDGSPTKEKGRERLYVTPPLVVGKPYSYEIRARWQADGKPVEQTRTVAVTGGARVRADFLSAPAGNAKGNGTLPPKEAVEIATDAYIYGYSLITTEVTRVQMSNVPKVEAVRAPMNEFWNVKKYPPADYRGVSAPNADTLYSLAWLDLAEPQVFSHPDMGKRYYMFEMVDLWMTDFETPSARTQGGKARNYLITGPGWKGDVPAEMKHIPVATRYMVNPGPHVCRRDRQGLRGGQRPPGPVQGHAALRL